ncbi:MAG: ribonuclease HI family protein [Candidatus Paceibacterota bacterium]
MEKTKILIHTDGGARGNPGPSAIGVVIEALQQVQGKAVIEWKKEYGEYLGEATNNEAEYKAVIFALKKLKQLVGNTGSKTTDVEVVLDSELIERQLKGEYKIKEKNLQNYFVEVWNLKSDFGVVSFRHVRREDNIEADRIVNQVLDRETNKLL